MKDRDLIGRLREHAERLGFEPFSVQAETVSERQ